MRLVRNHVEANVERLEEPNHDRRRKDDGERLGDKALRLVPCEHERRLDAGETIVGKLHDKGDGLTLERGVVEDHRNDHTNDDAQHIERDHRGNRRIGEERRAKQTVDRQLCGAAHEGREHDRHLAVVLGRKGARRHDRRNAAAKAHEHRHEAAPGQAKATQELIHNEGHACHIARVLENREQEEQDHDDGQERDHAANTREHAIDHHRADDLIRAKRRKRHVRGLDTRVDEVLEQTLQRRADHAKREPKHERHDGEKRGNRGITTREHAVDCHGTLVLATLPRLDHAGAAHALDEGKAHVRKSGEAIRAGLLLHLANDVSDTLQLVLVKAEGLDYELVPLDELGCRKANGDRRGARVVLDQLGDTVDAAVERAVVRRVLGARAEVDAAGTLAIARDVHRMFHKLADTLVLGGGDGNHGHAEQALEQVHVDGAAVGGDLVHHVERDDHGAVELHELERQIEVTLDVRGINDVDHGVGVGVNDELATHDLLARVGRERVDAREVRDRRLGVIANLSVLAINRHAGEVADVLVRAGQTVEERGLAAVLVAGEREGEGLALRHRLGRAAGMHALTQCRVSRGARLGRDARGGVRIMHTNELDPRGGVTAKRELIAAQTDLHGVAHGGVLHHRNLGTGRKAHIEDMLAERRVIRRHRRDHRVLANFKLIEFHLPASRHSMIARARPA